MEEMNKIWLISDTHLGHDKMVQYCGRPENHTDQILENIRIIKSGDTLIHLGDFCFGGDEKWHREFFSRLLGVRCVLVRGNHDKKSDSWYLNHGWSFVAEKIENVYFGKRILFSHKPSESGNYDINIHGHFHNNLDRLLRGEWVVEGEEERNKTDLKNLSTKSKLFAVEYTNYKPVLLSSFLA